LLERFRDEQYAHYRGNLNHEPTMKWQNVYSSSILGLKTFSNPFSKDHDSQKRFLQDVMLFVIKGFLPLRTTWSLFGYKKLIFWLCLRVSFPLKKVFIDEVLLALVNTIMTE
jgi:hypothetical protein